MEIIMDTLAIMENSYNVINRDFDFYKKNFGHTYYLSVEDDETKFIDKMFGNVKWEDFKYNCDTYLNKALQAQKDVPQYKISKTV
jgi:hypothetical protein